MQTDARGVIAAFLLMLLVGMGALSSMVLGSDYSPFNVLGASGWSDTTDWRTYRSDEYGFQVKYPPGFELARSANALVASGAVATFVWVSDPSIDGTGEKTNLIALSVTIGVSDSPVAPTRWSAFCLACAPGPELDGLRSVCHTGFTKSYCSEGGVGNRYEKSSYVTGCGNIRYEIALFVHSGNPGCYAPDTIAIFDPAEIARVVETMVGTFLRDS